MRNERDITRRTAAILASLWLVAGIAGCSRERQDWRSTQAADTIEAYDRFLSRHPESELAEQARERIVQLMEERDWERASTADTAYAYRRFIELHPNGKWSQEARIRLENFSLEALPPATAGTRDAAKSDAATASTRAEPASFRTRQSTGATTPARSEPSAVVAAADLPEAIAADLPEAAAGDAPKAGVSEPDASKVDASEVDASKVASASSSEAAPSSETASSSEATSATSSKSASAPPEDASRGAEQASGSAVDESGYGIQLGAFSTESRATEEWERLENRFAEELGQLRPRIVPAATAAGRLYRLQADVENEANARAICASLARQSQGCVVVLPHD